MRLSTAALLSAQRCHPMRPPLRPLCRRLQPVKETQQKQLLLWRDLLLRYCRHHRLHMLPVTDADDCPLFHNRAINREPVLCAAGHLLDICCGSAAALLRLCCGSAVCRSSASRCVSPRRPEACRRPAGGRAAPRLAPNPMPTLSVTQGDSPATSRSSSLRIWSRAATRCGLTRRSAPRSCSGAPCLSGRPPSTPGRGRRALRTAW